MAVIRYYLMTMRKAGQTVYLGATSAAEALKSIRFMRRDGWRVDLIQRGEEQVAEADLDRDAVLQTRSVDRLTRLESDPGPVSVIR